MRGMAIEKAVVQQMKVTMALMISFGTLMFTEIQTSAKREFELQRFDYRVSNKSHIQCLLLMKVNSHDETP